MAALRSNIQTATGFTCSYWLVSQLRYTRQATDPLQITYEGYKDEAAYAAGYVPTEVLTINYNNKKLIKLFVNSVFPDVLDDIVTVNGPFKNTTIISSNSQTGTTKIV